MNNSQLAVAVMLLSALSIMIQITHNYKAYTTWTQPANQHKSIQKHICYPWMLLDIVMIIINKKISDIKINAIKAQIFFQKCDIKQMVWCCEVKCYIKSGKKILDCRYIHAIKTYSLLISVQNDSKRYKYYFIWPFLHWWYHITLVQEEVAQWPTFLEATNHWGRFPLSPAIHNAGCYLIPHQLMANTCCVFMDVK